MEEAHKTPKVIDICAVEGLLEKWQESNVLLDTVQKGLEDYLETKRSLFARFYFLSNDELLEILSQTKDPTRDYLNLSQHVTVNCCAFESHLKCHKSKFSHKMQSNQIKTVLCC